MDNVMSRARIHANRDLPKYVSRFVDRHGKVRLCFRRKGCRTQYFTAAFGTKEFAVEYTRAIHSLAIVSAPRSPIGSRSIAGLFRRYCAFPYRLGPSETTQRKVRAVLQKGIVERLGRFPVSELTFEDVDLLVARRRTKSIENGREVGGVEAARKFRKELVRMLAFAEKTGLVSTNAAAHSDKVKVAAGKRSTGYHSWTEKEITQYRNEYALGTKARLAMELLLWTGQRRGDVVHLGRNHIRDGAFHIRQAKGGKALAIPVARRLVEAIDAMPANDSLNFLVTEKGKAFTNAGFGNWFRERCDQAGLPQCTAHGLRKAAMRRMAELGMSNSILKAMSGHTRDNEVAIYTAAADQKRLAASAVNALSEWDS